MTAALAVGSFEGSSGEGESARSAAWLRCSEGAARRAEIGRRQVGAKTKIEWTDATWNPLWGCSRVSEGCRNCYAERVAGRLQHHEAYAGLVQPSTATSSGFQWTGRVNLVRKHMLDPIKWKKPRRIFVNAQSDLFHENVPDEWIHQIFDVMQDSVHTFQILTKRPERMLDFVEKRIQLCADMNDGAGTKDAEEREIAASFRWPLPNVWLGVSVENQAAADERIPLLLQTPAARRFISAEPLLGEICLTSIPSWGGWRCDALRVNDDGEFTGAARSWRHIDWVICGGESGPGARPMHPDWARRLRDQCVAAGVPFFFKQWGEWLPANSDGDCDKDGYQVINASDEPVRVGKRAAGAALDGREWRECPTRSVF